jgi:transcription-repair coupling factor (superfamily II helicase)
VRPDHKVVIKGEFETPETRLAAAEKIAGQLAKVALAA